MLKKVYTSLYRYYIKVQSKRASGWVLHYSKKLELQLLLNLDNLLDFLIWENNIFEPEIIHAIDNIQNKDESLFIDIGSQIGQFSLYVRKSYPFCEVISFEPYKPAFYQQQANMLLNKLSYRLYLKAVSDKSGKATFYSPSAEYKGVYGKGNPAMSGLLKDQIQHAEEHFVETIRLDDFIEERKAFRTIIIKMDVEGAEDLVLSGGKAFLSSGKNIFLLIELLNESLPVRSEKINELLNAMGFKACNEKWEVIEEKLHKDGNYFYKLQGEE